MNSIRSLPAVAIDGNCPCSIALWAIALDEPVPDEHAAALSQDERERAARFKFDRDRHRYVAAHAALRRLLADATGVAAEALAFSHGEHGKPALRLAAGAHHCAFNLSHSEGLALVAIADDSRSSGTLEIGVDIEVLRPLRDAIALARRHYTPAECAALLAVPEADRAGAFLRCWTRKEACLKAVGSGFSVAPESFEAGIAAEPRVVAIDSPTGRAMLNVISLDEVGFDAVGFGAGELGASEAIAALAWVR